MSDPTRALLIDDDAELGELMREFFAGRVLTLAVEAHGGRGLAAALAGRHDPVILDVMPPGRTGSPCYASPASGARCRPSCRTPGRPSR